MGNSRDVSQMARPVTDWDSRPVQWLPGADLPPPIWRHAEDPHHQLWVVKNPRPIPVTEEIDGTVHTGWFTPGDICFLPAGSRLNLRFDEPLCLSRMWICPAFASKVIQECGEFPVLTEPLPVLTRFRDPKLVQLAGLLAEERERRDGGNALAVESLETVLVIHLLRRLTGAVETADAKTSATFPLADVLQHMQARLHEDLSLTELARIAHVSPPHLVKRFRRATGFSPHQYLIHLRIQRAKELLLQGRHSISEVAQLTGFADQSHFSRHFKRLVGTTPKSFLKRLSF